MSTRGEPIYRYSGFANCLQIIYSLEDGIAVFSRLKIRKTAPSLVIINNPGEISRTVKPRMEVMMCAAGSSVDQDQGCTFPLFLDIQLCVSDRALGVKVLTSSFHAHRKKSEKQGMQ